MFKKNLSRFLHFCFRFVLAVTQETSDTCWIRPKGPVVSVNWLSANWTLVVLSSPERSNVQNSPLSIRHFAFVVSTARLFAAIYNISYSTQVGKTSGGTWWTASCRSLLLVFTGSVRGGGGQHTVRGQDSRVQPLRQGKHLSCSLTPMCAGVKR